jgi:glycosyltransferase involved in cell wall biosynthesis
MSDGGGMNRDQAEGRSSTAPDARRPRLLFLVTEDWVFLSHRLPMARAARAAGFDVAVAARVVDHAAQIAAEGFRLIPVDWRRRNFNPLSGVVEILRLAALYRRERPDVVHHVALKPVVFGGVAARLAGVPGEVAALTGLGSAFVGAGKSLPARLAGRAARLLLRPILRRAGVSVVVQNPDDAAVLTDRAIAPAEKIVLIRGSGVEVDRYPVGPEPDGPVTVGIAARLLANKGIEPLIAAQQKLQATGLDLRLIVAGAPDPESPTSIPAAKLAEWRGLPGVELAGHVADVRTLWARCHIACLPSRGGEGIPKSLLEAAACGKPIVATDVPGCREITLPGRNGLLVPVDDVDALAAALRRLTADGDLRRAYGAQSRRLVESDLAADQVGARIVAVYRDLLARSRPDLAAALTSTASPSASAVPPPPSSFGDTAHGPAPAA